MARLGAGYGTAAEVVGIGTREQASAREGSCVRALRTIACPERAAGGMPAEVLRTLHSIEWVSSTCTDTSEQREAQPPQT